MGAESHDAVTVGGPLCPLERVEAGFEGDCSGGPLALDEVADNRLSAVGETQTQTGAGLAVQDDRIGAGMSKKEKDFYAVS